MRRIAVVLALAMAAILPARAQPDGAAGAVMLVAAPRLVDPDYRRAVLLAVPVEGDRYVGVILNRPTARSLANLFPGHAPSRSVRDPVYFGGPMLNRAIFAMVRSDHSPGNGSIRMMKDLFLATQAVVVDHIIEQTPNDARYYVGHVAWRPGELRLEIDRGLWYVLEPDPDAAFRKDPGNLWDEMLRRARAVTAGASSPGRPAARPL